MTAVSERSGVRQKREFVGYACFAFAKKNSTYSSLSTNYIVTHYIKCAIKTQFKAYRTCRTILISVENLQHMVHTLGTYLYSTNKEHVYEYVYTVVQSGKC